jgi:NADH-quinone oxidoreductase subunit I
MISGRQTTGKPIERPRHDLWENTFIWEIARGFWVTSKHFFVNIFTRRWTATTPYPDRKVVYPERYRGVHRLLKRQDGSLRCVACFCCATACPAECIHIEAGEYPEEDPRSRYEKYPVRFVVDELRCVFCGYCQEACPCDAIRLDSAMHAPAALERKELVYDEKVLSSFPSQDGSFVTSNPRG